MTNFVKRLMKILEIDFLVMKLVYVNWYFVTETFSAV